MWNREQIMGDGRNKVEPLDPGRVHLADPRDVAYWCKEFRCTEAQLKEAVAKVGEHAAAVREHLHN